MRDLQYCRFVEWASFTLRRYRLRRRCRLSQRFGPTVVIRIKWTPGLLN